MDGRATLTMLTSRRHMPPATRHTARAFQRSRCPASVLSLPVSTCWVTVLPYPLTLDRSPVPQFAGSPRFEGMRIVTAGGHGQIARQFGRLVAQAGHEPVGIVRKAEYFQDLQSDGIEAVLLDLESTSLQELTEVVRGADAVVFAAGGGPDGNAARKETVDKGAAVMLADAAEAAGVRRYVMVSAMGTENADPDSDEVFQVYLRAKQAADDDLRARDLDWTVVRPGRLTDDVPTGLVQVGRLERGTVTRGDVAHVLAEVLESENTIGTTFDLLNGDLPVAEAIGRL